VTTTEVTAGEQSPATVTEVTAGEQSPATVTEVTAGEQSPVTVTEVTVGEQSPATVTEVTAGEQAPVTVTEATTDGLMQVDCAMEFADSSWGGAHSTSSERSEGAPTSSPEMLLPKEFAARLGVDKLCSDSELAGALLDMGEDKLARGSVPLLKALCSRVGIACASHRSWKRAAAHELMEWALKQASAAAPAEAAAAPAEAAVEA
jgi:hypothetical protein